MCGSRKVRQARHALAAVVRQQRLRWHVHLQQLPQRGQTSSNNTHHVILAVRPAYMKKVGYLDAQS